MTSDHALSRSTTAALLAWGESCLRDLPWRATRDPWAVLVAETMLQQTQVERVVAPYRSFMARFPTAGACAHAGVGEIIRAWSGLGYNRRAVRLHAAAVRIVADHQGRVPATLDELRALPGVGAYTARAVLVFAYEQCHGVVDTNAGRVLARMVAGRSLTAGEAQRLADAIVPGAAPWLWNQVMLDLGATTCKARAPRCEACPVADRCAWARAGHPNPDPAAAGAASPRPQAAFEGSDRQVRGRLIAALRERPVPAETLAAAAGIADETRARRLAQALAAEGMAEWRSGSLALPGPAGAPSAAAAP